MAVLFRNFQFPILGGGYILKFSKIILNENIYFLIFTASLFILLLVLLFDKKYIKYYIILISLYLWFGLISFVYQEWFDPFYILFVFIIFSKDILTINNLNQKNTILALYAWETITLITAIYYYHFYIELPFLYNF